MDHRETTHKHQKTSWLQHLRHWLSHPTSEVLPPIFGDAVPPDLRILEAMVDEAVHDIQEVPAKTAPRRAWSKPARER